ncbi:hypothetical protein [Thermococcus sp.]|uniref:hypothetical protein n=1 Tax=Thermococcus sp. TaxID=35749 RepID=UPI00262860AB|nr:hypothetical protein [Thermococcus sp.]
MPQVEVDVFVDEIQPNPSKKINFMYIGALFVPVDKRSSLVGHLLQRRCAILKTWYVNPKKCPEFNKFPECKRLHWRSDDRIHYTDMGKIGSRKYEIAESWIRFLVEENNKKGLDLVYFNILGINLDNIDHKKFGGKRSLLPIYSRFFRTTILGGAKFFFGKDVVIRKMYHDNGTQSKNPNFKRQVPLMMRKGLAIRNTKVIFVDSNHHSYRNDNDLYEASNLLQFIDLILGTVYGNIHTPYDITSKKGKAKHNLAKLMYPLVSRLILNPKNRNSSFNYYKRQQIMFFPKERITSRSNFVTIQKRLDNFLETSEEGYNILHTQKDLFYTNIRLKIESVGTRPLDKWIKH